MQLLGYMCIHTAEQSCNQISKCCMEQSDVKTRDVAIDAKEVSEIPKSTWHYIWGLSTLS